MQHNAFLWWITDSPGPRSVLGFSLMSSRIFPSTDVSPAGNISDYLLIMFGKD